MLVIFTGEINGFTVSITEGDGYFCGYIHLPPDHPYFAIDYDQIRVPVRGGWTFSNLDDNGYWKIGFDTAHPSEANWTSGHVYDELARVACSALMWS
jgi:hypothetical protein